MRILRVGCFFTLTSGDKLGELLMVLESLGLFSLNSTFCPHFLFRPVR